jgi:hypothetical protein
VCKVREVVMYRGRNAAGVVSFVRSCSGNSRRYIKVFSLVPLLVSLRYHYNVYSATSVTPLSPLP